MIKLLLFVEMANGYRLCGKKNIGRRRIEYQKHISTGGKHINNHEVKEVGIYAEPELMWIMTQQKGRRRTYHEAWMMGEGGDGRTSQVH